MAEQLTTVARSLLANHQSNGTHLRVDEFVLAYIPKQDPSSEIDPDRGLPTNDQIVHKQSVTKIGYMSPDMVNYSLYMDDTVGPFIFNTIYTVATGESNAVIQIITVTDTPKIATDLSNNIRGQYMVRNAVLVYDEAAAITNITVEAAAWQFTYEKANTGIYGITKEATKEQTLSGILKGLFVSPFCLQEWWKTKKDYILPIAGQLAMFSTPTLPKGFPGFVLDNSTIPNGVNDYPELAESGSRWITIKRNDIILHDMSDVPRGQGTSERQVGDLQGDAMRKLYGKIGIEVNHANPPTGLFKLTDMIANTNLTRMQRFDAVELDSSLIVPTANEFRMRSKTVLFAIYSGRSV